MSEVHEGAGGYQVPPAILQRATEVEERDLEERKREACREFRGAIPLEYRWAFTKLDTLEDEELTRVVDRLGKHWEAADQYSRVRKVLLRGAAGVGKTCLAVRMLRLLFERDFLPKPSDRRAELRAAFIDGGALATSRLPHGDPELVRQALSVEVLVLDELGQPGIEPQSSPVSEVVYKRHAAGLTTWITTGLTIEQIVARYDDGFRRRVAEPGRALVLELGARAAPKATPSRPAVGVEAGTAWDPKKRASGDDS